MSQSPIFPNKMWNLVSDNGGDELLFYSSAAAEKWARRQLMTAGYNPDEWNEFYALYTIDVHE